VEWSATDSFDRAVVGGMVLGRPHWPLGSGRCLHPATGNGGLWKYTDLELDVVGNEQGFVELVDEDEFDVALGAGHIAESEALRARQAANDVEAAMSSLREPFAEAGWSMLARAARRSLPPTT
jgi:hypothetical protein